MIPQESYNKILADKRAEAPRWPAQIELNGESFEVRYGVDEKGIGNFRLIDGDGAELFPIFYALENIEYLLEADLLWLIAKSAYYSHFEEMDERQAALFLQIRMASSRDKFESWSRRDRAGLIEDRTKAGVTPEQIDELLGKPSGYTANLEDFSSDPRISELVSYRAAIGAASMLKGRANG